MARVLLPSFRFAVLLALIASVAPSAARADANAEARVLFEEGNRRLAAAMHQRGARRHAGLEDALESYVASLRIVRSRNAIFNAGSTLQELGRVDEAYDYYREYLALPDVTGQDRADAEARVAAITPQLAIVDVAATVPAEVRVDRRDLAPRGTTPLTFAVPAGAHTLFFSARGFRDMQMQIQSTLGATAEVRAQLEPSPIAVHVLAPPGVAVQIDGTPGESATLPPGVHVARVGQTERRFELRPGDAPMTIDLSGIASTSGGGGEGRLVVTANVDSRILVDGRAVATARTTTLQLPTGSHPLRLESPGRLPYEGMLDVREGGTTRAAIDLGRDPVSVRHMGAWPWVSLIVTGLVAAGAIGATVGAFRAHDAYLAARSAYIAIPQGDPLQGGAFTTYVNAFDDLNTKNTSADGLWIVTAIFAGLTTLLFLLDESDGPPTHGNVTVSASLGGLNGSATW